MVRPLSLSLRLLGIVRGAWGGGSIRERENPTKGNAPPPLSVIKIVKYCGVGGGGGGRQNPTKLMAPPLSVIKIIKYFGQKYNDYKQFNIIVYHQLTLVIEL